MSETFHHDHHIETTASPEAIWALFADVPGWKRWNAGIESIELDGPFATGTWMTMKPPGQDALRSRLVDVVVNQGFTDETSVGDLTITVAHRIERAGKGSRVTYAVSAVGPGAAEIGPAVSSDFPEVLAALAARAEGRVS